MASRNEKLKRQGLSQGDKMHMAYKKSKQEWNASESWIMNIWYIMNLIKLSEKGIFKPFKASAASPDRNADGPGWDKSRF